MNHHSFLSLDAVFLTAHSNTPCAQWDTNHETWLFIDQLSLAPHLNKNIFAQAASRQLMDLNLKYCCSASKATKEPFIFSMATDAQHWYYKIEMHKMSFTKIFLERILSFFCQQNNSSHPGL